MAVANKWDNPARTTARQDYGHEWYWCDFRQALPMLLDMLYCMPHPVDVIINMAADSHIDWRGAELHSQWLAAQWPTHYPGQIVVVANPQDFAHIHLLFSTIKPRPRLVKTLEAARVALLAGQAEVFSD